MIDVCSSTFELPSKQTCTASGQKTYDDMTILSSESDASGARDNNSCVSIKVSLLGGAEFRLRLTAPSSCDHQLRVIIRVTIS